MSYGARISTSVQQFLLPSFLYIICARTYIPIHNAVLRLFVVVFQEIQCLQHFHYDVGRQGVEMYRFVFHSVFLCQLHMPLRMYWLRLFFVVFQEIHVQCLHNFNHDNVCHVTEL